MGERLIVHRAPGHDLTSLDMERVTKLLHRTSGFLNSQGDRISRQKRLDILLSGDVGGILAGIPMYVRRSRHPPAERDERGPLD